METIFSDNALKLYSLGLSVIPISRNSKIPVGFMKNWSQYSDRLPTDEEIDAWSKRAPAASIAVVCGSASRVVCIDIDDDKLLSDMDIPRSPLVRRGKKGEARFFKWAPWMVSFSVQGRFDFIAGGKYVVIPPSIHPDTNNPYIWTGEYKTMAGEDKLPELNQNDLIELRNKYSKDFSVEHAGRNEKLKSMASAAFFNGQEEEATINELLEYDQANHTKPLFSDVHEQYYRKTRNEKLAAQLFVRNVWNSLSRTTQSINNTVTVVDKLTETTEIAEIPVPKSELLKKIASSVLHQGIWYNESVALAAALSTVSMLIANRFVLDNKWFPNGTAGNLFIMVLGETGIGKNSIKTVVTNIFEKNDFIEGYQSTAAAFIEKISEKRECMFLVDEISMHLRGMKNTKDMHTAAMCENLCDVFTANTNVFLPTMSLASKNKKTLSKIFNPYLTMLCATTPSGLHENTNQFLVEKGLLPRFLFLKQEEAMIFQNPEARPQDYSFDLKQYFKEFIEKYPIQEDNTNITPRKVIHRKIPLSKEAQSYFDKLIKEDNIRRLSNDASLVKDFLKRKMELISRVCLIDAVSSGNIEEASIDNLKYAEKVFEFSLHCIKEHVPIILGSDFGKQRQCMLNFIKKRSRVQSRELANRFRNIPPNERHKIISDLVSSGSISELSATSISGKPQKTYVFIEDII